MACWWQKVTMAPRAISRICRDWEHYNEKDMNAADRYLVWDGSLSCGFILDVHTLLCFYSLMQTITPPPPNQGAASKLIDNDNLSYRAFLDSRSRTPSQSLVNSIVLNSWTLLWTELKARIWKFWIAIYFYKMPPWSYGSGCNMLHNM